jgi:hypothetical protein
MEFINDLRRIEDLYNICNKALPHLVANTLGSRNKFRRIEIDKEVFMASNKYNVSKLFYAVLAKYQKKVIVVTIVVPENTIGRAIQPIVLAVEKRLIELLRLHGIDRYNITIAPVIVHDIVL